MSHDLRWVNRESRAGIPVGLYFICSCGKHGDLCATKAQAVEAHTNHAKETA